MVRVFGYVLSTCVLVEVLRAEKEVITLKKKAFQGEMRNGTNVRSRYDDSILSILNPISNK
jgi:hypothetical protein